jgi:histone acetyltransferase MCC1
MLDPRSEIYPTIEYRPIQPSDLEALEKIHLSLFPIRYLFDANASHASCFSLNAVHHLRQRVYLYQFCGILTKPTQEHLIIYLLFILLRYEREFFLNVVNGHGIVSWGAVDTSRSDEARGEIIGFVTTRMIAAKDSEVYTLGSENGIM